MAQEKGKSARCCASARGFGGCGLRPGTVRESCPPLWGGRNARQVIGAPLPTGFAWILTVTGYDARAKLDSPTFEEAWRLGEG